MGDAIKVRRLAFGQGRPKICVPLVGAAEEILLSEVALANATRADLVEWRADFFEGLDDTDRILATLRALRLMLHETPILFSLRTKAEGGECTLSKNDYTCLLRQVVGNRNADLIDYEWSTMGAELPAALEHAKNQGVATVVSRHEMGRTPSREEMLDLLAAMQDAGADLPKLAVMPRSSADVLALLAATDEFVNGRQRGPVITMAMGDLGVVSRVAGETFGSAVSFGQLSRATAPGQLPVEELFAVLDILHRKEELPLG